MVDIERKLFLANRTIKRLREVIKEQQTASTKLHQRKYEVQSDNKRLHDEITQLRLEREAHDRAINSVKEVPFLRQIIQYLTVANADLASAIDSRMEIIQLKKED